MSTLRVNTLQNAAGTSDPAISGAAKAWVNFNGTGTVAIRASFNVSSITDNGTGDYTVNFTTAFADANYAAMGCYQYAVDNTASGASIWLQLARYAQTTSAVRVACSSSNGTNYDGTTVTVAVFR
jgi:hypothetical protein